MKKIIHIKNGSYEKLSTNMQVSLYKQQRAQNEIPIYGDYSHKWGCSPTAS